MARPMPRPAPVTRAARVIFSVDSYMCFSSHCFSTVTFIFRSIKLVTHASAQSFAMSSEVSIAVTVNSVMPISRATFFTKPARV